MPATSEAASECWRPVPDYEGHYEVSDLGRVRSLSRAVPAGQRGGQRIVRERILALVAARTRRDGQSRFIVTLHKDGAKRWARVAHLVLEAFTGPRPVGHEGRHLDCDPSNNRHVNLAWGTPEQNRADSDRLGHYHRGEQHVGAKLTTAQVAEIRRLRAAKVTGAVIAAQFNVSNVLVYAIEKGKARLHG
jgi:hypothetical protein